MRLTIINQDFKDSLTALLKETIVTVTFTKKDGTDRVMQCTLNESLMPARSLPVIEQESPLNALLKDMPKKERKINTDVLAVYATDVQAWRSFRWDSIKSVDQGGNNALRHMRNNLRR